MIKLKRAYQPAGGDDGARFLVERLWPRGVRKTRLKLEGWLKDVAPSANLRKWFSHDPKKWPEFRQRYFTELRARRAAWRPLLTAARRRRAKGVPRSAAMSPPWASRSPRSPRRGIHATGDRPPDLGETSRSLSTVG